jgi:hypothetical protein
VRAVALVLLLAGCVQPPFSPADIQAKRFEALPDRAVIYIVRDYPDFSDEGATITLDDSVTITTYPGTYYRWEPEPGPHLISGFAADTGRIAFTAEAGRVYFVQQRVAPFMRFPQSQFHLVAEPHGRAAVGRAVLVGGQ